MISFNTFLQILWNPLGFEEHRLKHMYFVQILLFYGWKSEERSSDLSSYN